MNSSDPVGLESRYKFAAVDPDEREHRYGNLWAREELTGGSRRLVIAAEQDQIELLSKLIDSMTPPFGLLYVLVVTRGHAQPGRYQSPELLDSKATKAILKDFANFFEQDGRHHLWVASESGSEMLIYDRHNVIYAYGPLEVWSRTLAELGFHEAPMIRYPSPHAHHYHPSLDAEEDRLMSRWEWLRTPLRGSDEE